MLPIYLHIYGWETCFVQRIPATTPLIWHSALRLRQKRFIHTDLHWSTRMLQCETVSGILTPWSLLLLVSVPPIQRYCVSRTTFHCWATWWRGLDVAMAWTAWNPSPLEWTSEFFFWSSWLENMVCCMPGTVLEVCQLCFHFANRAMGLFERKIGFHNMLDELAALRTLRTQCYNNFPGTNK